MRPAPQDAASYYFTYIDKVQGDDCLAAMTSQLPEALALFAQVSEERSSYRYQPDKWSFRQVLGHIVDTERLFVFRALWFARGLEGPLPSFDQNVAVAGADSDSLSWAAHVEQFRRVRESTIDFFQHLPAAAWTRRGIASGNPVSVLALGFMVPGHLAHHMALLRERYF